MYLVDGATSVKGKHKVQKVNVKKGRIKKGKKGTAKEKRVSKKYKAPLMAVYHGT